MAYRPTPLSLAHTDLMWVGCDSQWLSSGQSLRDCAWFQLSLGHLEPGTSRLTMKGEEQTRGFCKKPGKGRHHFQPMPLTGTES